MTHTQWMFEYESLLERDREEEEKTFNLMKVFKVTLIRLLGLDLLADNTSEDPLNVSFIPLALMAGRREVAEGILEKIQKEVQTKVAVDDKEFEQLSEAMAKGNIGDMDPIIAGPDLDTLRRYEEANKRRQLEYAGVKLVDSVPSLNIQHVQVNTDKLTEKLTKAKAQRQKLEQDVADIIKEEALHGKRSTMMSFDDD